MVELPGPAAIPFSEPGLQLLRNLQLTFWTAGVGGRFDWPTGQWCYFDLVTCSLQTSATVATRAVFLEMRQSGGTAIVDLFSPLELAAGQTGNFIWGGQLSSFSLAPTSSTDGFGSAPIPRLLWGGAFSTPSGNESTALGGGTLVLSVQNLQAGDVHGVKPNLTCSLYALSSRIRSHSDSVLTPVQL